MNITIFGAAGFIGTNLIINLAKDSSNTITAVDKNIAYFDNLKKMGFKNVNFAVSDFTSYSNYDSLLEGRETVFHLVSTTFPASSNKNIRKELNSNIGFSSNLFDSCARQNVKKIVFLSSGGAVYGKDATCPINENAAVNPISSYGLQKLAIEKMLSLYNYMYGIDYRIVRLSNPYGPYQRPDSGLGVVSTFVYKALKGEEAVVYGDGSAVRDFIYIDDAVRGILKIADGNDKNCLFNLGCGYGTSINQLIETIENTLGVRVNVKYADKRNTDVPVNYLDIGKFENTYGKLDPIKLENGIKLNVSKFS